MFTPESNLATNRTHTFKTRVADVAGNLGRLSNTRRLTLDHEKPALTIADNVPAPPAMMSPSPSQKPSLALLNPISPSGTEAKAPSARSTSGCTGRLFLQEPTVRAASSFPLQRPKPGMALAMPTQQHAERRASTHATPTKPQKSLFVISRPNIT